MRAISRSPTIKVVLRTMAEQSHNDTDTGVQLRLVAVGDSGGRAVQASAGASVGERFAAVERRTSRLQRDTERLLASNARLGRELNEAGHVLELHSRVTQLLAQAWPSKSGLRACFAACEKILNQRACERGLAEFRS